MISQRCEGSEIQGGQFGYRCFDRVLLNGLIQPFQQPERVRIYAPLATGLLQPFSGDEKLPPQKRTKLDKLYQRVADDLSKLMDAVDLKAA